MHGPFRLQDIPTQRSDLVEGEWPVRDALGIMGFGVNAYVATAAGQVLIEDHSEGGRRPPPGACGAYAWHMIAAHPCHMALTSFPLEAMSVVLVLAVVGAKSDGAAQFEVVFEYRVEHQHRTAFERAYGRDGEWARFFMAAPAYAGTELWGCERQPGRYVVVDRWTSAAAYDSFVTAHAVQYKQRSASTASLYEEERLVGRFARGAVTQ